MSSDVSLCVLRIESSENHAEKLTATKLDINKGVSSKSVFRGRRNTCEILVENLPLECGEMTESGNTMKPLFGSVNLEKTLGKDALHFVSGNPFVEKTQGIIHLFKEDEMTCIERAAIRSQTVCILAVPSTITCSDLLTFMAPCREDIKHVRIIRDSSPNQYMSLVTFRSPESIEQFYKSYNGVPFSSLEPEFCCNLVFVSRVEILSEDEGGSVAPVSHTELPTCPVCLERMDESVDGILTIMCNHAFHGNCLVKWGDISCPVCRYVQTPEPSAENHCLECMATESLWICLICGHVGCGRYLQGHAYQHYIDTHHCYSMQLGSNSVWDYVGDNFVHRILQNKADGKLVEGPSPDKPVELEAKLEAVQLEYTYLLTSQLESQRTYYEEMISMMDKQNAEETAAWKERAQKANGDYDKLNERFASLLKEKTNLEKKINTLSNKLSSTLKQLKEEKEMNQSMRTNQSEWQEKYKQLQRELIHLKIAKEEELKEVKEQLRDVMFYLEAQKVVNDNKELKDGDIGVYPSAPSTSQGKKRGKRPH